jgi:hypothetical protein
VKIIRILSKILRSGRIISITKKCSTPEKKIHVLLNYGFNVLFATRYHVYVYFSCVTHFIKFIYALCPIVSLLVVHKMLGLSARVFNLRICKSNINKM